VFKPSDDMTLTKLHNGTHDLAVNLFCVDRPQYILLTTDSYRKQDELLDADDFAAALETLRGISNVYVIFNCSEKGGCSRTHKHLQGLLGPPRAWDLFIDPERHRVIPFVFFLHRFENGFTNISVEELMDVYRGFIDRCRSVLSTGEEGVVPHNVVLWDDTLVVVPRSEGVVGKSASANTGGMLGSVWVTTQEYVDEWVELGPRKVLEELGVGK
jgi:ATP adenylyltransferase/5',5'''-P-1,P-4-tetraphosphate phosphorylase II